MKGRVTQFEHGLQEIHLFEGLGEQDVQTAASVNQHSMESGVIHSQAENEWVTSGLGKAVWVICRIEGEGPGKATRGVG